MGDVDLVWSNCRSFNEADSEICDLADQAQQALRMRWQQEGLPTVTPIPPSAKKQKKKESKKRALDAGVSEVLRLRNTVLTVDMHTMFVLHTWPDPR